MCYPIGFNTVSVRVPSVFAWRVILNIALLTSTNHNTTNMAPIDEALAAIDSLEPGDKIVYAKFADAYGVDPETLRRRVLGMQRSCEDKNINQSKLNPQQEEILVEYINELTERFTPPKRSQIRLFATRLCGTIVSEAWVTRFMQRHLSDFISRWDTPMDAKRHRADSLSKYQAYFIVMGDKIQEHDIRMEDTYNIDKKGFAIGVLGRMKRIFTRNAFERKRIKQSLQDSNKEWVSLLAAVCADGSYLPPGLIFPAESNNIQDT